MADWKAATTAESELHNLPRPYVNFFMPTLKLQSKVRQGARVKKTFDPPLTPYERLSRVRGWQTSERIS